jgi:hypothetical protein
MIGGKARRWPAVACALAVAGFVSGCGRGGGGGGTNPTEQHITQMRQLYDAYKGANNGKPPANPKALKEWAQKQPQDKLALLIKDPLDSVFISPRDGEPYGIAPPPKGMRNMGPPRVVIYEKVGVNGKRLVASGMATVDEMDEALFKELVPNP